MGETRDACGVGVVGSDVDRVGEGAVLSGDCQPLVGEDDQGTSCHVSDSFHVS